MPWPSSSSCKANIGTGSIRCRRALRTALRRKRCALSATSIYRSLRAWSRRAASGATDRRSRGAQNPESTYALPGQCRCGDGVSDRESSGSPVADYNSVSRARPHETKRGQKPLFVGLTWPSLVLPCRAVPHQDRPAMTDLDEPSHAWDRRDSFLMPLRKGNPSLVRRFGKLR